MSDWLIIKTEYITTSMSYRQLAIKHAVSFRTLSDRAKREGWVQERRNFCNKVVTKTVQEIAEIKTACGVEIFPVLREAADKLTIAINTVLDDADQFYRYIITTGKGSGTTQIEERIFKKADIKAIKELCSGLLDLVKIVRDVYDLPTVQEKFYMDIAAKRLSLDEKKVGQTGAGLTGVVVTFEKEAQEYSE